MEEKNISIPEFLRELTTTKFECLETVELAQLAIKAKTVQKVLEARNELGPIEITLLQGFRFYIGRMDGELKKRNCYVVEAQELLENNPEVAEEILRSYPLEKLIRLIDELEKTKSEAMQMLLKMAEKEVQRRVQGTHAQA